MVSMDCANFWASDSAYFSSAGPPFLSTPNMAFTMLPMSVLVRTATSVTPLLCEFEFEQAANRRIQRPLVDGEQCRQDAMIRTSLRVLMSGLEAVIGRL